MDLIDLYHRRGISLVRSKLRPSAAARRGYGRLARRYADLIERERAVSPVSREPAELTPAL
jgi:hypothetical protein